MSRKYRIFSFILTAFLMTVLLMLCVGAEYSPDWVVKDMIRTEREPGLRFTVKIPAWLREDEKLEEYGFIVVSRNKLVDAGQTISNFDLDSDVEFKKGINYGTAPDGKKIDVLRDLDDTSATYSCVIHSIPREHYDSGIVAKAYLIYDGVAYYSTSFVITYLAAAENIRYGDEYDVLDENGKNVINSIISEGGSAELKKENVRIVSNHQIDMDSDGNWRNSYELYNPYTGIKEYDVPSVNITEESRDVPEALETGAIITLSDGMVDESDTDAVKGMLSEENLVHIGNVKDDGTLVAAPFDGTIGCQVCLIDAMDAQISRGKGINDILGNKVDNNFIPVTENTVYSVLEYDFGYGEDMYKYGHISLTDAGTVMSKDKTLLCYNTKAQNSKAWYAYFMKAFVCVGQDGTADFVLLVVNDGDLSALRVNCERDDGYAILIPSGWK